MAMKASNGDMIILLNLDTIPRIGSINKMIRYMLLNSKAGICGPKVLNIDGSFQKSCRRGIARPGAVFSYFLGLSRLYPKDVRYTGYHLDHIDENRLIAAPDCGLGFFTREQAIEKMIIMSKAAKSI